MSEKSPQTDTPAATPAVLATGRNLPIAVGTVAMQAWIDMGSVASRFIWDRLQQDCKTQKAILACTSLEDMRQVQAEFLAEARAQYFAEAGKMIDLMSKAATAGFAASSKSRRFDDVPI